MTVKDDRSLLRNHFERNQNIRSLLETNLLPLGFSIENLLKGLLIYQYKKLYALPENCAFEFLEKNIWKIGNSHDLNRLSKNAGLELTNDEAKLLTKLTKYSTWGGRYHIPKDDVGISNVITPGEGDLHTSQDQTTIDHLIKRVKELIV